MRMRRCLEWQFTTCDPGKNITWRQIVNGRGASFLDLQGRAQKAADVMFSQEACLGIRISIEDGIEAAFSSEELPEDPTLVLAYKKF